MLCKILPRFKVFIFVEVIFDAKNKYTCNDILSHAKKNALQKEIIALSILTVLEHTFVHYQLFIFRHK